MKLDLSLEVVKVLIVLLPGFVSSGVIRAFGVEEKKSDLDKVVRALIYSLIVYSLYPIVLVLLKQASWAAMQKDLTVIVPSTPIGALIMLALSVTIGSVVALYRQKDGHRIFRWVGITSRTTRFTIWHDIFSDYKDCYVAVVFKDGRQLFGWPLYFSDDAAEGQLFLCRARWYFFDRDGTEINQAVPEPGIFVRSNQDIDFIQFQYDRTNAAIDGTDNGNAESRQQQAATN